MIELASGRMFFSVGHLRTQANTSAQIGWREVLIQHPLLLSRAHMAKEKASTDIDRSQATIREPTVTRHRNNCMT